MRGDSRGLKAALRSAKGPVTNPVFAQTGESPFQNRIRRRFGNQLVLDAVEDAENYRC